MSDESRRSEPRDLGGRRAVVAGGGIGGAACALLLARAGARVTLLERVAEPKAAAAGGILLQPNGLAVLYGLGLEAALRARGSELTATAVLDAKGRTIRRTLTPDYGVGLDHLLMLRRSDLLAALFDAIAAEPAIDARFGAEVFDATAGAELTYRYGDMTETIAADLLVGADGARSVVRKRAGIRARVTEGSWYVRGESPATEHGAAEFSERWTGIGALGVGPMTDATYFYASVTAPGVRRAVATRDLAAFRAAWQRALPAAERVLAGVGRFEELLVEQALRVDCEAFVSGRVALVGDAAHAMAPGIGQGANSALVDAAVLAHELTRHDDVAGALRAYDARRRPAVRTVQDRSARAGRYAEMRHPAARAVRDAATRLAGRFGRAERASRAAQQEDPASLLRLVREIQHARDGRLDPVR